MPKETLIIILSIIGFLNAFYIHYQFKRHQKTGQKMYCLIGEKCGEVIGSNFGTTLGIENEIIGITYYITIILITLTNILQPNTILHSQFLILNLPFSILNFIISLAFLFSLYLLIIQTLVLHKKCSWCLIAITINTAIFLTTII